MQEKRDDHETDNENFLKERGAQARHCTFDEITAIVYGDDFHSLRESFCELNEFAAYAFDRGQCVFAVTHDDNARGNLAFAIEVDNTAP